MSTAFHIGASRHPLSDGHPPAWASGWGQDRFGAFVNFTVGVVTQQMRWCPPGTYRSRWDEHTLTRGFWLFDTPCTQELWVAVMGENPSYFKTSSQLPVEQVSWSGVQAFMGRLNNQLQGLELVLPTARQWEHACGGGTWEHDDLEVAAWYSLNSNCQTHPVARKAANAWGLYDMLGNVFEWCADGELPYQDRQSRVSIDLVGSQGPSSQRCACGGAWSTAKNCTKTYPPGFRSRDVGFRCARVQA